MATSGASAKEDIELDVYTSSTTRPPVYIRNISRYNSRVSRRHNADEKWDMRALKRSVSRGVADFFGVGDECPVDQEKWHNRSIKLHNHSMLGGKVAADIITPADTYESVFESTSQTSGRTATSARHITDPLARGHVARSVSTHGPASYAVSRQASRISTASSSRRSMRPCPTYRPRKDSVTKIALDGIRSIWIPHHKSRKPCAHSRSFTPHSITSYAEEGCATPDAEYDYVDDVFFDSPPVSPPVSPPPYSPTSTFFDAPSTLHPIAERSKLSEGSSIDSELIAAKQGDSLPFPSSFPLKSDEDETDGLLVEPSRLPVMPPPSLPAGDEYQEISLRPTKSGWRVHPQPTEGLTPQEDATDLSFEGMSRIKNEVLDLAFDNSNRREIGKGVVGDFFNRTYRRDKISSAIKQQMKDIEQDDHRAFFTWWVTFVQVVVYIIAVSVYGIAPIGIEERLISAEVIKPNLAIEKVSYFEKENLWIGPRQADLIHMGAKYSPCMRKDANVEKILDDARDKESRTACCVRNDGSGCLQTNKDECSQILSTWLNRTNYAGLDSGHIASGTVCGQDPKYCKKPTSTGAYTWSSDITDWPICHESSESSELHMSCKLAGRPCCVGIHGRCIITTREYCQFRHGYFHEEATLCSQISCMNEICGMIPFANPDRPDQFYRLWTSLFLHAGLLQLVITVLFQVFIMRDIEKLTGWLRLGIIYIGSGIAGSLSSAIFLPYHVEAGPAGSQFGILACLFTEVIQNYQILLQPLRALIRLFVLLIILFVIGLLPFVDNYAHLIGFIVGFLLSFALLPYLTFGKYDRRSKLIGIILCLVISCLFFAMLVILFYVSPIYNCPGCQYFNCIPFTKKFCKSMEVNIKEDPEAY